MNIEEQWRDIVENFTPQDNNGTKEYTQGGASVKLPMGCRWHGEGIFTVDGYNYITDALNSAKQIAILQAIMNLAGYKLIQILNIKDSSLGIGGELIVVFSLK